ncbi:hypothetical protein D3C76_1814900 [compost metagenome]
MMKTVTIAGTESGIIILANSPAELSPSITAASSISPGSDRINAARIITENGMAFAT